MEIIIIGNNLNASLFDYGPDNDNNESLKIKKHPYSHESLCSPTIETSATKIQRQQRCRAASDDDFNCYFFKVMGLIFINVTVVFYVMGTFANSLSIECLTSRTYFRNASMLCAAIGSAFLVRVIFKKFELIWGFLASAFYFISSQSFLTSSVWIHCSDAMLVNMDVVFMGLGTAFQFLALLSFLFAMKSEKSDHMFRVESTRKKGQVFTLTGESSDEVIGSYV